LVNKKLIAANTIFRYIRKGNVLAITQLNNLNAELLEFEVKSTSKVCDKFIKDLTFPRSAIIGGVIRNEKGLIALGDFKIQANDKVVVCCLPKAISKVEKLFL
jgi:trk system potassium uptake protein TrkA